MSQDNGNTPVDEHDHLRHNYLERVAPQRREYDERVGKLKAMVKVATALGYNSKSDMDNAIAACKFESEKKKQKS